VISCGPGDRYRAGTVRSTPQPGGEGRGSLAWPGFAAAHRILEHGRNTWQPAHAAPWPMTGRRSPARCAPVPARHAGWPAPALPISCVII